ncbi:hypothetical protein BV22DRAFT_1133153 [Leucogyrophana mollusca]|uniref:Uncharacterized protein n=1 Tax=Leucogyrophana mollusca TaxID=85980 RepID=A0ACB8B3X6_9AGAM|nr:hypothetical protein BV22DRAFT_1133153 [Leucogyrophana mollusca]
MVDTSTLLSAPANTSSATGVNREGLNTVEEITAALAVVHISAKDAQTILNAVLEATETEASLLPELPAPGSPSASAPASVAPTTASVNPDADVDGTTDSTPVPTVTAASPDPPTTAVAPTAIADPPPALTAPYGQGAILIPPEPLPAPQIWIQRYKSFDYEVPGPGAARPFYCITKGSRLGVFSGWATMSPLVIGVSRAVLTRVASVAKGVELFHEAVDNLTVELI